jgi:hypothetical protein
MYKMDDIETILENIRINSVLLNKIHKKRYLELQQSLKYFRIPIIILSSINSIVSVSQQFLPQNIITGTNSLLSLTTGIISSIEMFLGLNSQMENELMSQKEYYILATTIYKTLSLNPENRPENMKAFLEESYSTYIKLLENSCVIHKKIEDQLTTLPSIIRRQSPSSSDTSSDDEEKDKTPKGLINPFDMKFEENKPILENKF